MNDPNETTRGGPRIFVLGGSDSVSGLQRDTTQIVPIEGNNDSWRLIADELEWSRCHISPSYFRQGIRIDFSLCSVILNLVSDPDQNPKTLRVAERVTTDYRDRLINDPRDVRLTGRDSNSRKLQNIPGLHVPKVLRLCNPTLARLRKRMEAEGFSFPAIVRRTGTQTGRITGLFKRPEDMTDHFDSMKGDYYFIEYVDCRWSDGLYRKMRLFNIGGDVIFDHMFITDSWLINAGTARDGIMKDREDLRAEERRIFDGEAEALLTRAKAIMEEITSRIKLDYFGMDCSPTEAGDFVFFEANATMNITKRSTDPRFIYAQQGSVPLARQAMQSLLLKRAKPAKTGKSKQR